MVGRLQYMIPLICNLQENLKTIWIKRIYQGDNFLLKALHVLEQAKQRVSNEKKKQNENKRKAENQQRWYVRPSGSKFHFKHILNKY